MISKMILLNKIRIIESLVFVAIFTLIFCTFFPNAKINAANNKNLSSSKNSSVHSKIKAKGSTFKFLSTKESSKKASKSTKATNKKDEIEMLSEKTEENKKTQIAILAGGCFWGLEELLKNLDGVIKTEVGYIGGSTPFPTYELVKTGISGHAEAVKVIFDPNKISYEKLVKYFLAIHDPTQLNRQGNDIGGQYRSEIFYSNYAQKEIAENVLEQARKSGIFKKSITTRISKAGKFFPAEEFHQNYLEKHPLGYSCHHLRKEWLLS